MENVIELQNINKSFGDFQLKNLTMTVKKGYITGLIGGNGVGKSTTIKLIMNLLEPDSGDISIFGLNYKGNEKEIKQRVGFVFDSNVFYEHLSLKEVVGIISRSYHYWDDGIFQAYVEKFELPLKKKLKTFSKGMMMKTSIAIALSHQAELIIMDEPTSGLDPIFRRELLEILHEIMEDGQKSIFFSTHITTDLDRIADYITFLHNGEHIFTKKSYQIEEEYALVKGGLDLLDPDTKQEFISIKTSPHGFEALTSNKGRVEEVFGSLVVMEKPTLEDIMFYTKKGTVTDV